MRLTHVLIGMALILTAGLVTTHELEARSQGLVVPGLVVVEAPWLGAEEMLDLLDVWPEGALERVGCAPGALQPFGDGVVGRRAAAGERTVLFAEGGRAEAEAARTDDRGAPVWTVVLDGTRHTPRATGGPVGEAAFADAAAFVAAQRDVRPFTVGLMLREGERQQLVAGLHRLYAALEDLPRYRGGSLVVLGGPWIPHGAAASDDPPGSRPALRIDRPGGVRDRRPALRDLLDPGA